MAAIYSNGGNRWNILGFNFNKRDALSSVYKISMHITVKSVLLSKFNFSVYTVSHAGRQNVMFSVTLNHTL